MICSICSKELKSNYGSNDFHRHLKTNKCLKITNDLYDDTFNIKDRIKDLEKANDEQNNEIIIILKEELKKTEEQVKKNYKYMMNGL